MYPRFWALICTCAGAQGPEMFTREWEQQTGRTFNRWGDIATIIGLLDSDRRNPPAHRRQHDIEAMLQRAIIDIDVTEAVEPGSGGG